MIEEILSFWFGTLDASGMADEAHTKSWFSKDAAFDAVIRDRFAIIHAEMAGGGHQNWKSTLHGRLARLIVLDQFSRNLFRGDPRSFDADEMAAAEAKAMIEQGDDQALPFGMRRFVYMPLMHSEALVDQDHCVDLHNAWCAELAGATRANAEYSASYAVQHRDIVARFGRFPHRNDILERRCTSEELDFLKEPGSSF